MSVVAVYTNGPFIAGDYEAITVSTAVKTLDTTKLLKTVTAPTGVDVTRRSTFVIVSIENQPIRWTVDGTTPSSTVGHLNTDTDVIQIYGYQNCTQFKCIRSGATDALVKVTYYYMQ